jgi:glycosyltransferase involved in cell wall biosynthesis
MKRLTVIQTLPALNTGGVERGTLEVAAELVRRGHRSIVVSAGGELLDELLSSGSEHVTLPVGKKSLTTLKYIAHLKRLCKTSAADILHSRSRLPAWISYLAWKGLPAASRPRFVTSVHGPYSVNYYSKIMTRGERVIAVSEFIRSYIEQAYPDFERERICVIPRGVSRAVYPFGYQPDIAWREQWQRQYPGLQNKTLITLPGRLTRWKGQEDFLKVFSGLAGNDSLHGLIVGGPHPRKQKYLEELKDRTKQLGLEDAITFTGHRSDLKQIMSISSIVMSLSGEPEAFGRTVLEALCLGVPVIAYAHGGAREILEQIFPAGMVACHDTGAATERVLQFMQSRPSVPDRNPFSLQAMLDSTMNLYTSLARTPT